MHPQGREAHSRRESFWDLEAEKITPAPGMRLAFYDTEANDKGERDYLLFSGVIGQDEHGSWYAVIDAGSFHHESDVAADSAESSDRRAPRE